MVCAILTFILWLNYVNQLKAQQQDKQGYSCYAIVLACCKDRTLIKNMFT